MEQSSWTKFIISISGKKYSNEKIGRMFFKDVEKGDYRKAEVVGLINYAFSITCSK